MQDRYLCSPPYFFLGPAVTPHFFHSRITTAQRAANPGWKPLLDEVLILCISSIQWHSFVFMVQDTTKQLERWENIVCTFSKWEKKWSSYVLLEKSRHLRPTFLCNERVLQHDTVFFVQSSAVHGLRLWHVFKENYG